jgi:hypothetical protein
MVVLGAVLAWAEVGGELVNRGSVLPISMVEADPSERVAGGPVFAAVVLWVRMEGMDFIAVECVGRSWVSWPRLVDVYIRT